MSEGCKAQVTSSSGWHSFPCSRKAKRDGYCTQHHPDSVKARQEKSIREYEDKARRRSDARERRRHAQIREGALAELKWVLSRNMDHDLLMDMVRARIKELEDEE